MQIGKREKKIGGADIKTGDSMTPTPHLRLCT